MKPAHHRLRGVKPIAAVTTTVTAAAFALVLGMSPASAHCGTPQAEDTCPEKQSTTVTSGSYGSTTTAPGTPTSSVKPTYPPKTTTTASTPTTAATTTTPTTAPATSTTPATTTPTTTPSTAASTTAPVDATTIVETTTTLPRGSNSTTTLPRGSNSTTTLPRGQNPTTTNDISGLVNTNNTGAPNGVPVVATDTDNTTGDTIDVVAVVDSNNSDTEQTASPNALPSTGGNPLPLIVGGAGAVVVGIALLFLTRRRAHRLGL